MRIDEFDDFQENSTVTNSSISIVQVCLPLRIIWRHYVSEHRGTLVGDRKTNLTWFVAVVLL